MVPSFPHFDELVFDLESGEPLMVEDLAGLSLVESEVLGQSRDEGCQAHEQHQEGHVAVPVGVERIVTKLITIRLVVGVWLVHDQIRVWVGRENVLVAAKIYKLRR